MTACEQPADCDRVAVPPTGPASRLSRRTALHGLGGAGLAVAGLALAGRRGPSAAADHPSAPGSGAVVAAAVAAMDAHDLGAILALYAADAIRVALPTADGAAGVCRGTAAVTVWYERALEDGIRIELVPGSLAVDGARAAFALRTSTASWTTLGLGPLEGTAEAVIVGGLIRTHVVLVTPEAVRQLLAAQGVVPTGGFSDAAAMRGGTGALRR